MRKMSDQTDEKVPVLEMTQLEAMDSIIKYLHNALPRIMCAKADYELFLSERRFARTEIVLLQNSYNQILNSLGKYEKTKGT